MMRRIAIAGLPACLVLFGCSLVKPTSQAPAPTASATEQSPATAQGTGTKADSASRNRSTSPDTAAAANSTARPPGSAASQPASQPAPATKSNDGSKGAPRPAGSSNAVKPTLSAPKHAGDAPSSPAGAASTAAKPTVAAPAPGTAAASTGAAHQGPPPAPTLDLGSLEQRLKDTRAIGVFSKLSLKNQVDDLLEQFRAFHKKQAKLSLDELRQRYDLLLLKVLSLLQDGDPPLAAAIASSREALWGILTDPEKFAKI